MSKEDSNLLNLRSFYDLTDDFPLDQVFNRLQPKKEESDEKRKECRNLFFVNRFDIGEYL